MPEIITYDDALDAGVIDTRGLDDVRRREAYLERAEQLIAWAERPEEYELDDDVAVSHLLCVAAEMAGFAGELDRGIEIARRAVESADSDTPFAGHPTLIELLLKAGEVTEAHALLDQVRAGVRHEDVDVLMMERLGESLEAHGDPGRAERWYSIGLRLLESRDAVDGRSYAMLASLRRRARGAQGKGQDAYDELVPELRAEQGWGPDFTGA